MSKHRLLATACPALGVALILALSAISAEPPIAGAPAAQPTAGAAAPKEVVKPDPAGKTPAPPDPGESGKKPPKAIFEERPDEQYEQSDRVDPFTLGKPRTKTPPPPPPPPPNGGTKQPPPDYWGTKLAQVQETYRKTEVLLSSETRDRFAKVDSECNKHVPVIKSEIRELQKKAVDAAKYLHHFQATLEKFQRLQATAKRLQLRQDVEADFASKKIVVEGIVWRAQAPAAVVNGEMVKEGSVLRVGEKGAMIQVYRIKKHSVIFTYRGIQVSAHLQRGSL